MCTSRTCDIKCPSIGKVRIPNRLFLHQRIEGCYKTNPTIYNICTEIRHASTAITHMEVSKLTIKCDITSNGDIQISPRTQIGIEMTTKDIVGHGSRIIIKRRIMLFLRIPCLSNNTQTCGQLEIELNVSATNGRKKKIRICSDSIPQYLTPQINDRHAHTQSRITQILLVRALLGRRQFKSQIQAIQIIQSKFSKMDAIVKISGRKRLHLDGKFITIHQTRFLIVLRRSKSST